MQIDPYLRDFGLKALFIVVIIALSMWLSSCSTQRTITDTKMFTEQYLEVNNKQANRISKRFEKNDLPLPLYEDGVLTLTKEQVEAKHKILKNRSLLGRFSKKLKNNYNE